ncbi:MAG: arsinothricin resistance N-acetyltransferase ArsN1 family B [Hyphomicrobiaceae bacterium]
MKIRAANHQDAKGVAAIYGPLVRETAISFEAEIPTLDAFEARIAETQHFYPWLVADIGGAVAGYAYAGAHRARAAYRWSCEVSVYVDAGSRRGGVASALYSELLFLLARQNIRIAYAGITLPNPASVALHEHLGFRAIGIYENVGYKNGRWHDVGWWGKQLADPAKPVVEPIPLPELTLCQS